MASSPSRTFLQLYRTQEPGQPEPPLKAREPEKPRSQWEAPWEDSEVDIECFREADPRDPWIIGECLCADLHWETSKIDKHCQSKEKTYLWGANGSGHRADCTRCGVRLAYWPRRGHSGKCRVQVNPEVVSSAFIMIKEKGALGSPHGEADEGRDRGSRGGDEYRVRGGQEELDPLRQAEVEGWEGDTSLDRMELGGGRWQGG